MSLEIVRERLRTNFYRSVGALHYDVDFIRKNCEQPPVRVSDDDDGGGESANDRLANAAQIVGVVRALTDDWTQFDALIEQLTRSPN